MICVTQACASYAGASGADGSDVRPRLLSLASKLPKTRPHFQGFRSIARASGLTSMAAVKEMWKLMSL